MIVLLSRSLHIIKQSPSENLSVRDKLKNHGTEFHAVFANRRGSRKVPGGMYIVFGVLFKFFEIIMIIILNPFSARFINRASSARQL